MQVFNHSGKLWLRPAYKLGCDSINPKRLGCQPKSIASRAGFLSAAPLIFCQITWLALVSETALENMQLYSSQGSRPGSPEVCRRWFEFPASSHFSTVTASRIFFWLAGIVLGACRHGGPSSAGIYACELDSSIPSYPVLST